MTMSLWNLINLFRLSQRVVTSKLKAVRNGKSTILNLNKIKHRRSQACINYSNPTVWRSIEKGVGLIYGEENGRAINFNEAIAIQLLRCRPNVQHKRCSTLFSVLFYPCTCLNSVGSCIGLIRIIWWSPISCETICWPLHFLMEEDVSLRITHPGVVLNFSSLYNVYSYFEWTLWFLTHKFNNAVRPAKVLPPNTSPCKWTVKMHFSILWRYCHNGFKFCQEKWKNCHMSSDNCHSWQFVTSGSCQKKKQTWHTGCQVCFFLNDE